MNKQKQLELFLAVNEANTAINQLVTICDSLDKFNDQAEALLQALKYFNSEYSEQERFDRINEELIERRMEEIENEEYKYGEVRM